MVDHFHEQVIGQQKIGGQARAMVVTSGIERAIQYLPRLPATISRNGRAPTRRSSPSPASTSMAGRR